MESTTGHATSKWIQQRFDNDDLWNPIQSIRLHSKYTNGRHSGSSYLVQSNLGVMVDLHSGEIVNSTCICIYTDRYVGVSILRHNTNTLYGDLLRDAVGMNESRTHVWFVICVGCTFALDGTKLTWMCALMSRSACWTAWGVCVFRGGGDAVR